MPSSAELSKEVVRAMEFNTREVIDAPVEEVFAAATRFRRFAEEARRNGAKVQRRDPDASRGRGPCWDIEYPIQGAPRQFTLELTSRNRPDALSFGIDSAMIEGTLGIRFTSLSPARTEAAVKLKIAPKTIKARIAISTAHLAKPSLDGRFAGRIGRIARRFEQDLANGAGLVGEV